jgi:putative holliday junction resolvase
VIDTGCVLGIDVGSVRVGIASTDPTQTIAQPLETLQRDSRRGALWTRLGEVIKERDVQLIVVGLPRRLDGSEGTAAADARSFAREVEQRTGVLVEFCDERFTTAQADRGLIDSGKRRTERRAMVDAVAAALLLQGWLDARRIAAARTHPE